MEDGDYFEVYYKDDDRVRRKTLKVLSHDSTFVKCYNNKSGKVEMIPTMNIVRMESMEDGQKKNNRISR